MIYLRWLFLCALDWLMLIPAWVLAFPYSLFTAAGWPSWGVWLQTHDNPSVGDAKWQREGWFPHTLTGWKGWLNRAGWICRNPLGGFAKFASVITPKEYIRKTIGDKNISDKYGRAGWYFSRLYDGEKLAAFEFYAIIPYGKKCVRIRLGWKIETDKLDSMGFAPLVNTITPVKAFGK